MKRLDDSFERLWKAAARARVSRPAPKPASVFDFAAARQRESASGPDEWAWITRLFQRAVICSALVMVLSVGWSWIQTRNTGLDATELANYAMTIQLPP